MTDIVDRVDNRLFSSEQGNISTNRCSYSCITGRSYTPSVLGVSRTSHETGYTSCAEHRRSATGRTLSNWLTKICPKCLQCRATRSLENA